MRRLLPVLLLVLSFVLAACGGDEGSEASSESTAKSETAAAEIEFPSGDDKTIRALRDGLPEGAIFAPAVSVMRKGENRIGFALFDTARKQVTPEAVALYVAEPNGRNLRGPFPAELQSLRTKPQFMSRQAAADLESSDSFYTADVTFPKNGRFVVTALAQIDGEMAATSQYEMRVGSGGPPDVGEKAISVETETLADVGGDVAQIDTRIPPLPELHRESFADVLGEEPVVLVFATPQLCQTRVCGPVVDIAAEVAASAEDVTFIHQEIYVDNDINKGFREQVGAWRLPTEPWMFLVGEDGLVKERFEGAVSVAELQEAVDTKLRG